MDTPIHKAGRPGIGASEEYDLKHSALKGERRERQAARVRRNQAPKTRKSPGQAPTTRPPKDGAQRRSGKVQRSRRRDLNLLVRGELRDSPDISKIARAVIHMALAQEQPQDQHPRSDQAPTSPKGDRA